MSNENKIEFCKCNELAEKLEASAKDNQRLVKMIRDLRQENHDMQTEMRNRPSDSNEWRSGTNVGGNGYKEKFEALVEINHGWKKDYEELRMRYEILSGEKRLLEDEDRKLKGRINEQQKRNKFLEGEIARLAGALYTQQCASGGASPSEEQCELLKLQMVVYKEDFERERQDRENLNEKKEKYEHKLDDAEEIIRKLTAELDACKALEQARRERGHYSENGYLSERGGTRRHQVQLMYPYPEVNERWRMEQQRKGILPRNPLQLMHPYHQVDERWQMAQHTLDNCIPDSLTQGDNVKHYT